jgi:hypothetical protein
MQATSSSEGVGVMSKVSLSWSQQRAVLRRILIASLATLAVAAATLVYWYGSSDTLRKGFYLRNNPVVTVVLDVTSRNDEAYAMRMERTAYQRFMYAAVAAAGTLGIVTFASVLGVLLIPARPDDSGKDQ